MSCGNKLKNCHAKSCQRYFNNNAQPFAAGVPLTLQIAGARVVDSGISIDTQPQSYTTLKVGLYHLAGDIIVDSTTAGTGTFAVYMDGVILPCTARNVTLRVGTTEIHTETDLMLTACCCDVSHTFTFVLVTETAVGNVTQCCTGVMKEA